MQGRLLSCHDVWSLEKLRRTNFGLTLSVHYKSHHQWCYPLESLQISRPLKSQAGYLKKRSLVLGEDPATVCISFLDVLPLGEVVVVCLWPWVHSFCCGSRRCINSRSLVVTSGISEASLVHQFPKLCHWLKTRVTAGIPQFSINVWELLAIICTVLSLIRLSPCTHTDRGRKKRGWRSPCLERDENITVLQEWIFQGFKWLGWSDSS